MKATEKLCRTLIRGALNHGLPYVTSWDWFGESRDLEIVGEDVSQHRLLRAMAFGKNQGWLEARWGGVGLTPYAGSARRQRTYDITEKGKIAVKGD